MSNTRSEASMAHLKIEKRLPAKFDLIDAQRSLQGEIYERHKRKYKHDPQVAAVWSDELLDAVRFNEEAIRQEFAEILDRLPWKRWKQYAKHVRVTDEDRLELKYEGIDVLHFVVNLLIALGFESWDEVERWYVAKNKENLDRQERGY